MVNTRTEMETFTPLAARLSNEYGYYVSFTVKGIPELSYPSMNKGNYNFEGMPSLYLLVNPNRLAIDESQIITGYPTLGGHVQEYWGANMPTMSCDGQTPGFMHTEYGYTAVYRRETQAYQNFMDLLSLYMNNGAVYDVNGEIIYQGYIQLDFDTGSYIGKFTDFQYSESKESPFMFEYSFSFLVEETLYSWVPLGNFQKRVLVKDNKPNKPAFVNPTIAEAPGRNTDKVSEEVFRNTTNSVLNQLDTVQDSIRFADSQIAQAQEDLQQLLNQIQTPDIVQQIKDLRGWIDNFNIGKIQANINGLDLTKDLNNIEGLFLTSDIDLLNPNRQNAIAQINDIDFLEEVHKTPVGRNVSQRLDELYAERQNINRTIAQKQTAIRQLLKGVDW